MALVCPTSKLHRAKKSNMQYPAYYIVYIDFLQNTSIGGVLIIHNGFN